MSLTLGSTHKTHSTGFIEYEQQKRQENNNDLDLLTEIQSLDWILPETRQLLERQYKLQMSKHSKSNNSAT